MLASPRGRATRGAWSRRYGRLIYEVEAVWDPIRSIAPGSFSAIIGLGFLILPEEFETAGHRRVIGSIAKRPEQFQNSSGDVGAARVEHRVVVGEGEWVELKNLTPQGFLRFRLPRIALGFESRFASGERIRHRPEVHTVILEPDVRRIVMVWQSTLRCPMKEYKLLRTVITRKSLVPPLLSR